MGSPKPHSERNMWTLESPSQFSIKKSRKNMKICKKNVPFKSYIPLKKEALYLKILDSWSESTSFVSTHSPPVPMRETLELILLLANKRRNFRSISRVSRRPKKILQNSEPCSWKSVLALVSLFLAIFIPQF